MIHAKLSKTVMFIAMATAFSGCGKMDFTLTSLLPKNPILSKPAAQGVEVVSGASTAQHSLNGYIVDASVGTVRDQIQTSTPNGYTVYHGVKGAIVSDD